MNARTVFAGLLFCACSLLSGCFGLLKPDASTSRYFILTPIAEAAPATAAAAPLTIGVGQVKLPGYLFDTRIVERKDTNEIAYLPMSLWAERLDAGIQRVLAANLGALTPAKQVRLSAWQRSDVKAGVYVTVEQLDVDSSGRAVLAAWWRIVSPDGEQLLKSGQCRLTCSGQAPAANPQGAVASMSQLLGELSRQLAQAIRDATSATHQ